MSFQDLDSFIIVHILDYCVQESSFAIVLSCREIKEIIYRTPSLLSLHCNNINNPVGNFKKNTKHHRYQYTWWLLNMNPKTILDQTFVVKIEFLDVCILKEFFAKYPKHFDVLELQNLCSSALRENKKDVFDYLWKLFGKIIVHLELNFINQGVEIRKYPVITTLFDHFQFDIIKNLYGRSIKDFPQSLWIKVYENFYGDLLQKSSKGQINVQHAIETDKRFREEFFNNFHIRFNNIINWEIWWKVVIINEKTFFLYHLSFLKQKSNTFIQDICFTILRNFCSNLYFWVIKNWKKLDKLETLRYRAVFNNCLLFDLQFESFLHLNHPQERFLQKFVHSSSQVLSHSLERVRTVTFDKSVLSCIKIKKIRSIKHFDFIVSIGISCDWSHTKFADCDTLLYVLRYLKTAGYKMKGRYHYKIERRVFCNLMKAFNQQLFDFWIENHFELSANNILAFLYHFKHIHTVVSSVTMFKNNALHFNAFLNRFEIPHHIMIDFLQMFFHYGSCNLCAHFEVFKKHNLLTDEIMDQVHEIANFNKGLKLWLNVNGFNQIVR